MSKLLCNALAGATIGVASLIGSASAENWIPISIGDFFIVVPQVNFKEHKNTQGHYTLSWNRQTGAESYKVERLGVDETVIQTSTTIPTKWKTVAEQTATSLLVVHNLSALDLGGHQRYRLSVCSGGICDVVETLDYFVKKEELVDTKPLELTATAVTQSNNLKATSSDSLRLSSTAANPYAYGKGYSYITGHEPPGSEQALRKKVSFMDRLFGAETSSAIGAPKRSFTLEWKSVVGASHYIVTRIPDRGENPTYNWLYQHEPTDLYAEKTTFNIQLRSGVYDFVVHACVRGSFCGAPSDKTTIDDQDTGSDVNHQVQNLQVTVSGDDITVQWDPPSADADAITNYQAIGELRGIMVSQFSPQQTPRQFTRNRITHNLPEGRKYCYSVRAQYIELGQTVNGEYAPGKCVSFNGDSVLPAPDNISIVNQNEDPGASLDEDGYVISWSDVGGADYYQLDREYAPTGTWSPIYIGTQTQLNYQIERSGFIAFRVSACRADGLCGDYRRLYFEAQGLPLNSQQTKSPSCLNVPTTVLPGNSIPVSWCAPKDLAATDYEILDHNGGSHYKAAKDTFGKTIQGLFVHNMPAKTQGSEFCFGVKAYFGSEDYQYENRECGVVAMPSPNQPTINITDNSEGDYTISWNTVSQATKYMLQQATCSDDCSSLIESDWIPLDNNMSDTMFEISAQSNGLYAYRVSACSAQNVCSGYSNFATAIVNKPTVIFLHTDFIGTPVAATDENGDEIK